MIITVDLSKLSEVWITLETIIVYLKQRIKESVKEANKINPKIKERLKKAIIDRIDSNPDESKIEPIALPTAIVATKYDIFETYEPEKQKIIAKTLRFVAHFYGASLIVIFFIFIVQSIILTNFITKLISFLVTKMKLLQVD